MSERLAVFRQHRARLLGIAYRMLGSRADAEDMVQEAYIRWHGVSMDRVQTARAWLITTVTRLCIDRLRSTRSEREAYIGPWLPEPLDDAAPPADAHAELASDLSVAFLVMLERLAPEERAAFLLHDVFDSAYSDIARMLGKNEAACRQIVHRARNRVRKETPRFKVSEAARQGLLERFLEALQTQDQASLLTLFAPDVSWTADGGGKVKAATKVVRGADLVSRFATGIWRRYLGALTHKVLPVNGESGLVMFRAGKPTVVLTIETDGLRIMRVFAIVNPDKLKGLTSEDTAY